MAKTNYGYNALNSRLNSQLSNTSKTTQPSLTAARVISVISDDTHPRFKELGGWSALGAIEYDLVASPSFGSDKYPIAYPLNSNIKHYPLIHEIVELKSSFDSSVNSIGSGQNIVGPSVISSPKKYYTNIVNVWNHPHHNGYSFKLNSSLSQTKDYDQTQIGSNVITPDEVPSLILGKTFKERDTVNPLFPFEGDIIYEGRWGNSIRFGSTVMASASYSSNDWSTEGVGNDGDPITIIRNGQGQKLPSGAEPVLENINADHSSIYLTSTQNIKLGASAADYTSYNPNNTPAEPSSYIGAQILLNSGRLVFNTYNDHLLLTSARSINLNALESVNIDSPELSVQANKIYLGKYKANEPLMLGIQTVNLLKNLVKSLTTYMSISSIATTNVCVPGEALTLPTINSAAQDVLDDLYNLSKVLGSDPELKDCNLTSKRNYTV